MRGIIIPKEVLHDLYWKQRKTPDEIAKMYGLKYGRSVRKKMEKFGIRRRTLSEAMTKKFKAVYSGDLDETAYLMGLRAGDFHARRMHESIRIQTSTTHLAQFELLKRAFEKYAVPCKYFSRSASREDEWFIYADLHPSFLFLLDKAERIPPWILGNNTFFFNFLAAYADCEGNWHMSKSHGKHPRFTFRLRTCDKQILSDITKKLEYLGYHPIFGILELKGTNRGYGKTNNDYYGLILNRKEEVISLSKCLISLSKHSEKIRAMDIIINHLSHKADHVFDSWRRFKGEIKKEKALFLQCT